jgi:hypothetical protein
MEVIPMKVRSLLFCAALVPFVACKDDGGTADDEATAAAQGGDSVQVTDDEAQTVALTLDGSGSVGKLPAAQTGVELAVAAMARVGAALTPPSCHGATQSGATVTYSFSECTGPYGMAHLTGTVVAVYSVSAAGASVHVTTTDFHVNQSTISVDADATYSDDGGSKSLTVSTDSSGTGPLGHTFTHEGDYTLAWTATCHTLDGSWSTTANGLARTTSVSDLSRCEGFCPASGGSISHTYRNGATLTLTYEGATLHWAGNNRSGTIALTCTPET